MFTSTIAVVIAQEAEHHPTENLFYVALGGGAGLQVLDRWMVAFWQRRKRGLGRQTVEVS